MYTSKLVSICFCVYVRVLGVLYYIHVNCIGSHIPKTQSETKKVVDVAKLGNL